MTVDTPAMCYLLPQYAADVADAADAVLIQIGLRGPNLYISS